MGTRKAFPLAALAIQPMCPDVVRNELGKQARARVPIAQPLSKISSSYVIVNRLEKMNPSALFDCEA